MRTPRSTISRAYPTRTGAAILIALSVCACRSSHPRAAPSTDLIAELPHAERRSLGDIDAAIRTDVVGTGAGARLAIAMKAPARVIWLVRLPNHSYVHTAIALAPGPDGTRSEGVTARIGISDGRSYDQLFLLKIAPDPDGLVVWHPVDVDLGAYSGWQWSLFYRPSQMTWRLNFSVDLSPAGILAWSRPVIDAQ